MNGKEKAQELFALILKTAGVFLNQSKRFSVEILKEEDDPSFGDIAKLARDTADIIDLLASDFDPMLHQKALDYTNIMHKMAVAIKESQQDVLDDLTAELGKKPFL